MNRFVVAIRVVITGQFGRPNKFIIFYIISFEIQTLNLFGYFHTLYFQIYANLVVHGD